MRDFPTVQWVRRCASSAGGLGSLLGWGTKISHALWLKKLKKKKKKEEEDLIVEPWKCTMGKQGFIFEEMNPWVDTCCLNDLLRNGIPAPNTCLHV